MGTFELLSLLLTLAALFSFASRGLLGLPATAGVFLLAFGFAFATAVVGTLVPAIDIRVWEERLVTSAHLPEALLEGVLAFLLFAGAVEQDSGTLWRRRWAVALLATLGVVISTGVMGTGMWLVFDAMGQPVPLIWCLVLGAALAPTDPVAVLAVLRKAPLPEGLRTAIAGESLFNDGMGVVLFALLLGLATGTDTDVTVLGVAWDIVKEAGGGVLLGLATGSIAFWAKSRADDPAVELSVSLALAAATYSLAQRLGLSGPIAVVVAGLLIGNTAKHHVSSERTGFIMKAFWSMVDAILNAILFMLVGLEAAVVLSWQAPVMAAAFLAPLLALVARLASVLPVVAVHLRSQRKAAATAVLTWGGVRGGIAVALVLSLPDNPHRDLLLVACYAVVAFTIIAQSLTLGRLARRLFPEG
ncbi:cation:proton antiporter [Azospirillum argentinense]|uniref:Sodium:proton antiporter n=1 Tax=Azospirillum brasilense TaxID=192 RepID=A0A4D8Q7Y2_AZOBR|nr:sodium:proton antiporter [Azospirillum argentinense]QCO04706.1 sodium:proton antiporter [Azospirillum argentinense]